MYYIWLVVGGEDSGLSSCLSQVVGRPVGRQDLCDMMKKIVFISIFASSIAGTRRSSGCTTGDCDNYMSGKEVTELNGKVQFSSKVHFFGEL